MSDDHDEPPSVARGRARVDPYAVPVITGRATVPGALSVPRAPKQPIGDPAPVSPSMVFEAEAHPVFEGRAHPPAEDPTPEPAGDAASPPVPAIRTPAPGVAGQAQAAATPAGTDGTAHAGGDVSDPVRKKGFAVPAVAALLAALIVGGAYLVAADRLPRLQPEVGRWGVFSASVAAEPARPAGDPFAGRPPTAALAAPSRLRIKEIGVDTTLERLGLDAKGALQPPKVFAEAGWYAAGTAPGDIGPAVIAGHVDSKAGPAVFYRLRELGKGDQIEVVRGGRTLRFTVVRTRWFAKTGFDTADVYGPTPDRQLRLITCGGVFDRRLRSYRENLVVYAVAG